MATNLTLVEYTCDWKNELGEVCGEVQNVSGADHEKAARDLGWGWYANAAIRWERWGTGAKLWFCPVHATVFRNNHGWGGLEDYGPPNRPATGWWKSFFKKLT